MDVAEEKRAGTRVEVRQLGLGGEVPQREVGAASRAECAVAGRRHRPAPVATDAGDLGVRGALQLEHLAAGARYIEPAHHLSYLPVGYKRAHFDIDRCATGHCVRGSCLASMTPPHRTRAERGNVKGIEVGIASRGVVQGAILAVC